jgi:hypothetical protein
MPGLFQMLSARFFLGEERNQSGNRGQDNASADGQKFNAVLNHLILQFVAVQNCLVALHINRIG